MTASPPLRINHRVAIPRTELRLTFARSSGPGGQNVNKVNSKVQLRWTVAETGALPPAVRDRFLVRFSRRFNDRGELILTSQRYRDQGRNVNDCFEKLRDMVLAVLTPPTKRKKTAPTRASREVRLGTKRTTGEKKRLRKPPSHDD